MDYAVLRGAILPPATGMLIAIVDPDIRPFANAISMVCYNVLGYSLGNILPGAFMQWLTPKHAEDPLAEASYVMKSGMRLVLGWAAFGWVGMLLAWLAARRDPSIGHERCQESEIEAEG